MDFLKKAKAAAKDAESISDSMKKLGIKSPSFGGDNKSSSASIAPSVASTEPVATPASSIANVPTGGDGPAVPVNTAEGAHTGKLPLAIRKNVRDNFESEKSNNEQELSKIMGTPWTIYVDIPGVYSYAVHQHVATSNYGGVVNTYFTSANGFIKKFVEEYGDDGKTELNRLASRHLITLEPTTEKTVSYGGPKIVDGRLVIEFKNDQLGVNNYYVMDKIAQVVNEAGNKAGGGSSGGLSMATRQSIKNEYDPNVEDELKLARKYLNEPEIQFEPNFEANYAALLAFANTLDYSDYEDVRKLRKDWADVLGQVTLAYFKGFNFQLKTLGFNKDDMLQEGFNETVDKKIISFVIHTKKPAKGYADISIEDGIFYIRIDPENYWVGADYVCEKMVDLL